MKVSIFRLHQAFHCHIHCHEQYYLHHQGLCCSFNTQSNGFESKVSNENTREDLDYEDFRNPENEVWEELGNEKEEVEEVIENEEGVEKPLTETARSGGLISRLLTISTYCTHNQTSQWKLRAKFSNAT